MTLFWCLLAIAGVIALAIVTSEERSEERRLKLKVPLATFLFWTVAGIVGVCILATFAHATDINFLNPCLLQGPKPTAPSKQLHTPKPTPAAKQLHGPVPQKEQPKDPPMPLSVPIPAGTLPAGVP